MRSLLDHKRTWHFVLTANPEECVNEFVKALQGKNVLSLRKANWSLSRDVGDSGFPKAIGTYEGRGGISGGVTLISGGRAQAVEEVASGSQLTFEVQQYDEDADRSTCAMWLSLVGKAWVVFTADAGFYRSYMNDVARGLRQLDPGLQLVKA